MFSQVCVCPWGLWSQVPSGGRFPLVSGPTPSPVSGPVSSLFPGPARGKGREYPQPGQGYPASSQDRGLPLTPSPQPGQGYPFPPHDQDRRVNAVVPEAEALLWSRVRTFLCNIYFIPLYENRLRWFESKEISCNRGTSDFQKFGVPTRQSKLLLGCLIANSLCALMSRY